MSNTDKTLLWMVLCLSCMALSLGLGAVWLNIERTDMAYDLQDGEEPWPERGSGREADG